MNWSKALIPTLKEVPREAVNKSHILLLRGGFIKALTSGVYSYLPLGWRVLKKIMNIVREEMDRIGAQEVLLPALTPSSIWEETGRWDEFGGEMFRLKDRKGRDYALAPTHEEIMTELARKHIKSYRDLPQIWYQIQIKYRDEIRPRGAVLRARTFIMKDSYSFDIDEKGLEKSYALHYDAYTRIFERAWLKTSVVSASSGLMGGSESHEFMVLSDAGEDVIVKCPKCGYSANLEVANLIPSPVDFPSGELKKVHTPVGGSVREISEFLSVPEHLLMKSLLYMDENGTPFFVVIRGDYDVNEELLFKKFGNVRQAEPDEIKNLTGASAGYISPIGLEIPVYADRSLEKGKGLVSGANEDFYHYTGIDIERDLKIKEFVDIRTPHEGDLCPECRGKVEIKNAIELGHIFKLGTKYSKAMGATFTDANGRSKPIVMGSYGIGIERIMATAIELYNDENGIIWPDPIAPFDVLVIPLDIRDSKALEISRKMVNILEETHEVLFDDRDVGPGFKFKDADLIGIPVRVVVGPRSLKEGKVEVSRRDGSEKIMIEPDRVQEVVEKLWKNGKELRKKSGE